MNKLPQLKLRPVQILKKKITGMKQRLKIYRSGFNGAKNSNVSSVFYYSIIQNYFLDANNCFLNALLSLCKGFKAKKIRRAHVPDNKLFFRFRIAFVVLVSLYAARAEAALYTVTAITVSATQTGSVTYGTGGNVTYTITLTESGNGSPAGATTTLSLNWTGGTPTGVTFTPNTAVSLTGTGQVITLTIISTNSTPAANKSFTVTSSSGSKTSGSATYVVSKKALSVTAPTVASKIYDASASSGTVTVGTLSGFVGTETVTATATGTFADANVGASKSATIVYTLADGTAIAPGDYTAATGTVTIPAGSATANVPITIINDTNFEREYNGLIAAMDFFSQTEGLIISYNQKDLFEKEGKTVRLIPEYEFLSEKHSHS